MDDKIIEELKEIITPYLEDSSVVENVRLDSNLKDELNMDSADMIEIVLDLEEHFKIEIEDDQIEGIKTLGDILSVIKQNQKV